MSTKSIPSYISATTLAASIVGAPIPFERFSSVSVQAKWGNTDTPVGAVRWEASNDPGLGWVRLNRFGNPTSDEDVIAISSSGNTILSLPQLGFQVAGGADGTGADREAALSAPFRFIRFSYIRSSGGAGAAFDLAVSMRS